MRFHRMRSRLLELGLAGLLSLLPATVSAQHKTIVDNGPSSNRVDIVFLGDGYTAADHAQGIYAEHIQSYVDYLFTAGSLVDPYPRYKNYFNVHRIDVVSNQSGADRGTLGSSVDTALDASYYYDGTTERLLYINDAKANAALDAGLAGTGITADQRYVTVNDSKYGGGGGQYAVYAGGNTSSHEIALHEMGHSFSQLADEYAGINAVYTGSEPTEPNVTKDLTGAKWSHWLGYEQTGMSVIGVYEGAGYYEQGLYRPSENSKMRSLEQPFNAIGREKIILDIYDLVDPLDAWLDNSSLLFDPNSLWVDRIDDSLIAMEWFVGGDLVEGATDATFNPLSLGIGPGNYLVSARAYDPFGFDSVDGWVRSGSESLEQFVEWQVSYTVPEPSSLLLATMGLLGCVAVVRIQRRRRTPGSRRS